jgi:hypothetical protein
MIQQMLTDSHLFELRLELSRRVVQSAEGQRAISRLGEVWRQAEHASTPAMRRILRESIPQRINDIEDSQTRRLLYKTLLDVETLIVNLHNLDNLARLQIMDRSDWKLTFSVDNLGSYPQVRWGRTPLEERIYKQGPDLFEQIANSARSIRQSKGRFFVSYDGVFYKENDSQATRVQVLRFEFE